MSKKKSILRVFTVMSFLILSLIFHPSCGDGSKTEKEQSSIKEKIVSIGAFLPLTGNLSFLGTPGKNVIEMVSEELKKDNIEVKLYDTQADSKIAVNAFQKAVEFDGIKIFLTTLTGVSQALKPMLKQKGLFQGIIAIYPKIAEDNPLTFQICYNAELEIEEIIKYIDSKKFKKIFVFQSRDPITKIEVEEYLSIYAEKNNIKIISEEFDIGSKSFSDIVAKYIHSKVELGVLLGYGSDFQGILKEIGAQKKKDILLIGGIGYLELPDYASYEMVKNSIFIAPKFMIKGFENPQYLVFKTEYKKLFGKEVTYDAAYTYDGIKIIKDAIRAVNNGEPSKIAEFLLKNEFQGITGTVNFSSKGTLKTEVGLAKFNEKMEIFQYQ